jgi:hypothetical protein
VRGTLKNGLEKLTLIHKFKNWRLFEPRNYFLTFIIHERLEYLFSLVHDGGLKVFPTIYLQQKKSAFVYQSKMGNQLFIMLNILFKGLCYFALKRIIHALAKANFCFHFSLLSLYS